MAFRRSFVRLETAPSFPLLATRITATEIKRNRDAELITNNKEDQLGKLVPPKVIVEFI